MSTDISFDEIKALCEACKPTVIHIGQLLAREGLEDEAFAMAIAGTAIDMLILQAGEMEKRENAINKIRDGHQDAQLREILDFVDEIMQGGEGHD